MFYLVCSIQNPNHKAIKGKYIPLLYNPENICTMDFLDLGQVKKMLLSATLPALRSLRTKGKSRRRTRKFGSRGRVVFTDVWRWPKGNDFLFPNRAGDGHVQKDTVCHAIVKARKSFVAPINLATMLEPNRIRSHSGRHRMINDLKNNGIPCEAGMTYARIKDKKTYDNYGKMDQEQSGRVLNQNKGLKRTLKAMYS